MKVAFINRPKSSWIGGDYVQMEKTAEALRKLNIEVDIFETPTPQPITTLLEYDIIHLWNFTMNWSKIGIWVATKIKKPVVCSMIYHSNSSISQEYQQIMIDNLTLGLFLCENEVKRARQKIQINNNYAIIPNGIDKWWLESVNYKTQDYVLTVGRIDGTKGQLRVAEECKKLGYRYLMVGEKINDSYFNECIKNGAEWLGIKQGEELKKVYAECRVFALLSDTEVMPLTVMEAGALNKPVVLNDKCLYNFVGISKSIEEAWNETDNKELYNFVSSTTWDDVAQLIKKEYETITN